MDKLSVALGIISTVLGVILFPFGYLLPLVFIMALVGLVIGVKMFLTKRKDTLPAEVAVAGIAINMSALILVTLLLALFKHIIEIS